VKLFSVTFIQAVEVRGMEPRARTIIRAMDVHRLEYDTASECVVVQVKNAPGEDVKMIPLHSNVREMVVNDKALEKAEALKVEAEAIRAEAERARLKQETMEAEAATALATEAALVEAERVKREAAVKVAEDAENELAIKEAKEEIARAKAEEDLKRLDEEAELEKLTAPDPLPEVANPFSAALKKKK